jgi:hypothetical protein
MTEHPKFTVNDDGTVTIPAGVTLDEATVAFWTAVVAKGPAARIKALENKIEELELELLVRLPIQEYKAELRARIAELEAENAKLRAALKPFADAADHWIGPDEASIVGGPCTLGDLRAARAAYLGEKND